MTPDDDVVVLERQLIAFARSFGLHQGDVLPDGEPVPVSETHALSELAAAGPLSQRELGERLGLAKATVSRIVDLLVERGWVRRERSGADARVVEVRLTTAGRAAARRLATRRRNRLRTVLDTMAPDERTRTVEALQRFVQASRDSD